MNPIELKNVHNIIAEIDLFKRVYESCAFPVPPYRITASEHKILLKSLKKMEPLCVPKEVFKLEKFLDVTLEIVQVVEEYI